MESDYTESTASKFKLNTNQLPVQRRSTPRKSASEMWKITTITLIMNAFVYGSGWLITYYLVLSSQSDQNRAQTLLLEEQTRRLTSSYQEAIDRYQTDSLQSSSQLNRESKILMEKQIEKLDSATTKIRDELENFTSQAQAVMDTNRLVESISPNVELKNMAFLPDKNGRFRLNGAISNGGSNSVIVNPPTVTLSRKMDGDDSGVYTFVNGKDYQIFYRAEQDTIRPGVALHKSYEIAITNSKLLHGTIDYRFSWKINTNPTAISIAKATLKDRFSSEIADRSNFTQHYDGSINF